MYSRLRRRLGACAILLVPCFGCNDSNEVETTLRALERGKAEGKLIFTTDGRVSASQEISFGFGAGGSSLSFSGEIDFGDDAAEQTVE